MTTDLNPYVDQIRRILYPSLETYSNVHRGSGQFSQATTAAYEEARDHVLGYLQLSKRSYTVIFCSPRYAGKLLKRLQKGAYRMVSSAEFGLAIGVRAIAVKKRDLPKGAPPYAGGGTARLTGAEWVLWDGVPERFEAGTPAIINILAMTAAMDLHRQKGPGKRDIEPNPEFSQAPGEIFGEDAFGSLGGKELLDALRQTLVGCHKMVSTREGQKQFINFDNSASTPTFEPVWKVFCRTMALPEGKQCEILSEARSIIASALGAPPESYELIFTSNTTEAINLAAECFPGAGPGVETVILGSMLEHSSNDLPWRAIAGQNYLRLSIDAEGFFNLGELESLLREYNETSAHGLKRIRLVAVSGASNVLGSCNNLQEISRIVHRYGAKLLVDAAQLVAHRKVETGNWDIDYLAMSAHKVYAPFGCGLLIARKELLKFSKQELEEIHSSGEENVAGIAAFAKALSLLQRIGMEIIREEEQQIHAYALEKMNRIPGMRIHGLKDPVSIRLADMLGIIIFDMKGNFPNKLAKELAEQGAIGTRYGCHCAHILVKHVLGVGPRLAKFQKLMLTALPNMQLPGVTRVSFGLENSREEVDTFVSVLRGMAK